MLRKLLLSTAIIAVSSTLAYAADAVPIDDPVPPAIDDARFDWGGFYIGGQAGYSHGSVDWLEGPNANIFPFVLGNSIGDSILSHSSSGGTYGITGGYNWQYDNLVFGIEGSYSWTDLNTTTAIHVASETTEIKSIWTVGPRIGIANGNFLLYAEGGYASAEIELSSTSGPFIYNASKNHHGYYLGVGVDWALNQNWVLGIEYNHTVLGSEIHSDIIVGLGSQLDVNATDINIDTVTARLLYKF